jgi:hypothetical protein
MEGNDFELWWLFYIVIVSLILAIAVTLLKMFMEKLTFLVHDLKLKLMRQGALIEKIKKWIKS